MNITIKNWSNEQIEDLRMQLEDYDNGKKASENKEEWMDDDGYHFPEDDEMSFFINHAGNIDSAYGVDGFIGNCFKTRRGAEKKLEFLKAVARVNTYINENHPFKPDWSDENERKHFIRHSVCEVGIYTDYNFRVKSSLVIKVVSSEEEAEDVIENCKDDLEIIFDVNQ